MDKRVYSALSAGSLLNQVKLNINEDIVTLNKGNNYYLYDDISYNIKKIKNIVRNYSDYIFTGVIYFSIHNNAIMLNMNITTESFDFITQSNNYNKYKDVFVKKQYMLNRFDFHNDCIYAYNKNIPLLKVIIKMYKDFRLPSKIILQLEVMENVCTNYDFNSNFNYRVYTDHKDVTHHIDFSEIDECQKNRSKYCLLSALQRLAVYKSLYCILPDLFLLDRAFKMFCKRQHGINHNSFLRAHKNY